MSFFCDRCNNGFRTPFKSFGLGAVTGAMDVANSLFGGILGRAADVSERVSSASRERAHDQAFLEAANELRPEFIQCRAAIVDYAVKAAGIISAVYVRIVLPI